ncbi:MAG: ATP synthase F1 subunit delta, partial [Actinomycetota bacterium]|nr:ATP synthase F1 subunit delta [Actinomycetota bacterium]
MSDEKIQGYARAILAVASAESNGAQIEDEIYRFSQVLQSSEELKSTLSDASIPSARRQQIVEDLLDGQATQTTVALVSMIVAAGMGSDLKAIADRVIGLGAESRDKAVAEVYSVVDLSSDQQQRLAAALKSATGKDVEMKIIIDESVMGGLLVQIEDEVIDGTVRT